MIIYSATKSDFVNDVFRNVLVDKLVASLNAKHVPGTSPSHIRSYQNSLRFNPNPAGHGRIPRSSGSRAKRYARQAREGVCRPERAHAMRGVSSSRNLPAMDTVRANHIALKPCAYLHNYAPDNVITNSFYAEHTGKAPVFLKHDAQKLQVRPGFRARHNYASRPGRKAGGDFSAKIAEAGSRKTAMRFMRDHRKRCIKQRPTSATDKNLIFKRNSASNKARLVAGYCWDWASKWDASKTDINIPEENFAMKWNLAGDGNIWIIKPEAVSEVGCIHTCQGLELDYVGVIVGPDLIYRDGRVITDHTKRARSDASVKGFKGKLAANAEAARQEMDSLIKNTYKTLMTRGTKGCYVYFTDKETAAYFKSVLQEVPEAVAAPESIAAKLKKIFNIEPDVAAALKYVDYLPVFSLEAACGNFGRGMAVEPQGWIKCPPGVKPDHNMFAAKVSGRSMEPKLEDGDYCVFRANVGGTRNNKLVLVQHSSIADPNTGGSYSVIPNSACGITREAGGGPSAMRARPDGVYATRRAPAMRAENFIRSFLAKKYTSKKKYAQDGTWEHEEIILKPLNPEYSDIVIPNAEDEEFVVVAEVVGQCDICQQQ